MSNLVSLTNASTYVMQLLRYIFSLAIIIRNGSVTNETLLIITICNIANTTGIFLFLPDKRIYKGLEGVSGIGLNFCGLMNLPGPESRNDDYVLKCRFMICNKHVSCDSRQDKLP